jgi:hypothetical protein
MTTETTTWGSPSSTGKMTFVEKLNQNGKRPAHRVGQRTADAPGNLRVLTDWHLRPQAQQKYESNSFKLELHVSDALLRVAAEADRCNQQYAIEHKSELFAEGTDELDIKSYYKPLCGEDNLLRVKMHKSDTKVFKLENGGSTQVPIAQLPKYVPVCIEVADEGLWVNKEDGSWGPRWNVRNIYITGSPNGPSQVEDDEFADA